MSRGPTAVPMSFPVQTLMIRSADVPSPPPPPPSRPMSAASSAASQASASRFWSKRRPPDTAMTTGRLFLRERTHLTAGERSLIAGIVRNRGDLSSARGTINTSQIGSHKDAWLVGKAVHVRQLLPPVGQSGRLRSQHSNEEVDGGEFTLKKQQLQNQERRYHSRTISGYGERRDNRSVESPSFMISGSVTVDPTPYSKQFDSFPRSPRHCTRCRPPTISRQDTYTSHAALAHSLSVTHERFRHGDARNSKVVPKITGNKLNMDIYIPSMKDPPNEDNELDDVESDADSEELISISQRPSPLPPR